MDLNKSLPMAQKQAEKAIRADSVEISGSVYTLTFKPLEWVYSVHDSEGNFVVNFNTKKITQAKKWLREYFASCTH
jgi:Ser/Thr protein kinase RdoA (MazF antagonist)